MLKPQYASLFLSLALLSPVKSAHLQAPPDVPNFYQVNDHVFRGGQPGNQAWPGLAKMGVKLVIDLRREDEHSSAAEARAVHAAGMNYVNVPMKGVVAPSGDQVSRLLSLLE